MFICLWSYGYVCFSFTSIYLYSVNVWLKHNIVYNCKCFMIRNSIIVFWLCQHVRTLERRRHVHKRVGDCGCVVSTHWTYVLITTMIVITSPKKWPLKAQHSGEYALILKNSKKLCSIVGKVKIHLY